MIAIACFHLEVILNKCYQVFFVHNLWRPRWRCQMDVTSDQIQVQRTRCVYKPKLQGLGFGSSALKYDQRSPRPGDGPNKSQCWMVMV